MAIAPETVRAPLISVGCVVDAVAGDIFLPDAMPSELRLHDFREGNLSERDVTTQAMGTPFAQDVFAQCLVRISPLRIVPSVLKAVRLDAAGKEYFETGKAFGRIPLGDCIYHAFMVAAGLFCDPRAIQKRIPAAVRR